MQLRQGRQLIQDGAYLIRLILDQAIGADVVTEPAQALFQVVLVGVGFWRARVADGDDGGAHRPLPGQLTMFLGSHGRSFLAPKHHFSIDRAGRP